MGSISGTDESAGRTSVHQIIDIRSDAASIKLKQHVLNGLNPKNGEDKTLPTLLLYDDSGLRLFERITYLDEYYLTEQEIALLEKYANHIADQIPDGAMVVELGSGCVDVPLIRPPATD